MSIFDRLSFLPNKQTPPTLSGRMVVVHWDRDQLFYFISNGTSRTLKEGEFGVVPLISPSVVQGGAGGGSGTGAGTGGVAEESKPQAPLMALAKHLQEQRLSVNRLVVLLARPELDLLTLSLPPASNDELPILVAAEVEQQQGETQDPPAVDYFVIQDLAKQEERADRAKVAREQAEIDGSENLRVGNSELTASGSGKQVFAFALNQRFLQGLQDQCNEAGFKLLAIGSRHLAPLSLLRQANVAERSLAISIHLLAGEAEVAICRGSEPLMLRSIRYSNEDPERVAEQIDTEANRCLTLLPQSLGELPVSWMVYETGEFARQVAKSVEAQEPGKVRLLDPLTGWSLGGPSTSAATVGAALDLQQFQSLPVNLLAPKRAPTPPNPWLRWGGLGGLAAAAAVAGSIFMLQDVGELREQATAAQNELKDTGRVTSKYQEKSDQVAWVEGWLGDQVDWVSELSDLASRLPDGKDATVRRLTATINAKGNGALDLSMQVKSQEIISELENRIRGAKYTIVSKQITQNADSQEYPWQFESHIEFPIQSPGLRRFIASKVASPSDKPAVWGDLEKGAEGLEKVADPPQEAPLKTEAESVEQERKGQEESGS
jgi:hypothetical protein